MGGDAGRWVEKGRQLKFRGTREEERTRENAAVIYYPALWKLAITVAPPTCFTLEPNRFGYCMRVSACDNKTLNGIHGDC